MANWSAMKLDNLPADTHIIRERSLEKELFEFVVSAKKP
jgi:hypothetical protein